jgi:hypothetical protein
VSEKRKILVQLDSDPHPSVFDRVVAIDAGADEVFSYGGVKPEAVRDLVHGAIFTRGPKDLKRTAIFVGGSDATAGERLLEEVRKHMVPQYGLRVSVMLDANGANTTAVAAVRAAANHFAFTACKALVLAGTGPVGQRVALLLAQQGADVRLASRVEARAAEVAGRIRSRVPGAKVSGVATASPSDLPAALEGRELVIAAGAAGICLLPRSAWKDCPDLRVLIDLNAVPTPEGILGIEGIEATDAGKQREHVLGYGAIGVGGTKMKIHRAAVARLFESNDQVLDAEQIYALAQTL